MYIKVVFLNKIEISYYFIQMNYFRLLFEFKYNEIIKNWKNIIFKKLNKIFTPINILPDDILIMIYEKAINL